MQGSMQRMRDVINGRQPDRPPLFDLLRNDAVLSHFSGRTLTVENAEEVVYPAYAPAIDGTRPMVRLPANEGDNTLPDGRRQKLYRWTSWTEHLQFAGPEEYAAAKREQLKTFDPAWSSARQAAMVRDLESATELRRKLGEIFLIPGVPSPGLMGLTGEVGLELFSYCLADYPGIIEELLEMNTLRAIAWVEHLPENHGIEAGFLGDDIAFKSGPLHNPTWMRQHYFPCLARIIDALHKRQIKVLFHSDGNLNPILDDLVDAGIDGLNPIEIMAGMDVDDIHRRYPRLFMAGGIDVSQLLPFGTPDQVRDAVRKAIDAADGRIMIGSSTELNNEVPLANFLAMRDTVLQCAG